VAQASLESEQLLHVVGDLRGGFAELGAVGGIERLDRGEGVVLVLSGPNIRRSVTGSPINSHHVTHPTHCPGNKADIDSRSNACKYN
jgi:hypothetical protein